jgi:hypothetical protein
MKPLRGLTHSERTIKSRSLKKNSYFLKLGGVLETLK